MFAPCRKTKKRYNLDLLLTTATREGVVEGRIIDVQEHTNGKALDGDRGPAAKGLAAECPLRLNAMSHICGHHIHLRNKNTGRVGCFAAGSELLQDENFMEAWEYTASQQELIKVLHGNTTAG